MTTIINLLSTYVNENEKTTVATAIVKLVNDKAGRVAIHDKSGKIVKYRDIPADVLLSGLTILLQAYDKQFNASINSYIDSKGNKRSVDGFTLDFVYNTVNSYIGKDGKRAYQLPMALLSIARNFFNIDCLSGRGLRRSMLLDSTKEQASSIIEWAENVLKQ